jgi:hypothetical protein
LVSDADQGPFSLSCAAPPSSASDPALARSARPTTPSSGQLGDVPFPVDRAGHDVGHGGLAGGGVSVPTLEGSDDEREATPINATAVGDESLAWNFGGGSGAIDAPVYVLDRQDGTLRVVTVPGNAGDAWVTGDWIAWSSLATGTRATELTRWNR